MLTAGSHLSRTYRAVRGRASEHTAVFFLICCSDWSFLMVNRQEEERIESSRGPEILYMIEKWSKSLSYCPSWCTLVMDFNIILHISVWTQCLTEGDWCETGPLGRLPCTRTRDRKTNLTNVLNKDLNSVNTVRGSVVLSVLACLCL